MQSGIPDLRPRVSVYPDQMAGDPKGRSSHHGHRHSFPSAPLNHPYETDDFQTVTGSVGGQPASGVNASIFGEILKDAPMSDKIVKEKEAPSRRASQPIYGSWHVPAAPSRRASQPIYGSWHVPAAPSRRASQPLAQPSASFSYPCASIYPTKPKVSIKYVRLWMSASIYGRSRLVVSPNLHRLIRISPAYLWMIASIHGTSR
jgi:hypothetical protein